MYGRLGTLYLAQQFEKARRSPPSERGAEPTGKHGEKITRSEAMMFLRLALVVCGMIAAVTVVMTLAG